MLAVLAISAAHAQDWWDPAYAHRNRLTFLNSDAQEPLEDFPVMVRLVDGENFDHAMALPEGTDLRFIDADGTTELPFEVELWDVQGESVLWVQVPEIEPSDTDHIWMYFGNPLAQPPQGGAPWSSSYVAVYHLADGADSGPGGRHGIASDTSQVEGLAGFALELDEDAMVTVADDDVFDLTTAFTLSAWVQVDEWNTDRETLIAKGNGAWRLQRCDDLRPAEISINGSGQSVCAADPIDDDQWHQVVGVFDASVDTISIFQDGALQNSRTNITSEVSNNGAAVTLGYNVDSTDRSLQGRLDEVRIESVARSASWIYADYLSVSDAFVDWCSQWAGDEDDDGVCDGDDRCENGDDLQDTDGDLQPDDCDACPLSAVDIDFDTDGACSDVDCDDGNASIYPGAPDTLGNGIDEDCSGQDGPGQTPLDTGSTDGPTDAPPDTGGDTDTDSGPTDGATDGPTDSDPSDDRDPFKPGEAPAVGCSCDGSGRSARWLGLLAALALRARRRPAG